MTQQFLYPAQVDLSHPISPELLDLWDEAMKELKRRRNRNILWQIPTWVALFYIIPMVSNLLGISPAFPFLLLILSIGFIEVVAEPDVLYSVSEDRCTAMFKLRRKCNFAQFPEFLTRTLSEVKNGLGATIAAVFHLALVTIFFPIFLVFLILPFINNRLWLKDFREIGNSIRDNQTTSTRQHLRGTEMLPSVPLSGAAPDSEFNDDEAIEILGGKIKLLLNGGLIIEGGMAFDENATFENLAIDDMVLTRADAGLLRISCEGKEHAYYFNGSNWTEV